MTSQHQIAANRKNAPKGVPSGPRYNAHKHGLIAERAVINIEDEAQFNHLLASFRAEFEPAGLLQNLYVDQMALATWRLRRLHLVETGAFNFRLLDHKPFPSRTPATPSASPTPWTSASAASTPSATYPATRPNWSASSTEPSSNSSASSP